MTGEVQDHGALRTGTPPPPSEDIHLPRPSYLPIVLAAGITLTLVGIVLSWVLFVFGAVVFLVTLFLWVRSAREELAELPLERR